MSKSDKRFNLDPNTLTYHSIPSKQGIAIKNIIWIILSSLAFGVVFIMIILKFFPSPEEKKLQYELSVLEKNYQEIHKNLDRSLLIYESLLEKEQELNKLTFDIVEEDIQPSSTFWENTDIYSSNFNFTELLNLTSTNIKNISVLAKELPLKIIMLFDLAYGKQIFSNHVPSILPIEKENMILVSGYGERIHPMFKTLRMHNGIDFAARQGTPIVATANGTVIATPRIIEGLGNTVAIDHGFGYISIYGCLLKSDVKRGQKVNRGQVIGSIGKSGIASGPHLHYEVWLENKPVNPINYIYLSITPIEFRELIEKASKKNQSMS
jgi:murein DD-endopeptidase MepM/ murein hydrolase activator NlpD